MNFELFFFEFLARCQMDCLILISWINGALTLLGVVTVEDILTAKFLETYGCGINSVLCAFH